MPYGNWATVREAAEHYGVTRQRIHQLILKGFMGKSRMVKGFGHDITLVEYPFRRTDPATRRRGKSKKKVQEGVQG